MDVDLRIRKLREHMAARGIDLYLVVTDDFHGSEYVSGYFKCRRFITGFTGSAGTAIITRSEAFLWTDGRYFLQAEDQLRDTEFVLCKSGEPGVPTVEKFITENMKPGMCIGYDGRTIACEYSKMLKKNLPDVRFIENVDLIGEIWSDRPSLPEKPVWILEERFAGESCESKLEKVRLCMAENSADLHILTSLDDICWLLNLRGDDVSYSPIALCYCVVMADSTLLYIAGESVNDAVSTYLTEHHVEIRPYDSIYQDVTELCAGRRILLSEEKINAALLSQLPETCEIIDRRNITTELKSIKNAVEQENERQAHLQDGVAVAKLHSWISKLERLGRISEETELSVAEKLLEFRKERPEFIGESFNPIIATGDHGAVIHYGPTPETDRNIQNDTFLLMDTGGHYYTGTTDITRTIAIGTLSQKQKEHYTAVLKGNLNLGAVTFKKGCTGVNLDILARKALWELGLDYNHGTGHGVGYLLNVHEGPQGIRSKERNGMGEPFAPGMITSNEPGVYIPGEYGIRLENLVLCVEDGGMLHFDTLTMVPFDRRAILPERLNSDEKQWLNDYHEKVFETIAPYLEEEEAVWLREATLPIE